MITTYATTFSSTSFDARLRYELIDVVANWLADSFPLDERGPNVMVRVREDQDDPVYRVVVDDSRDPNKPMVTTSVTIVEYSGLINVEIRCLMVPKGNSIAPAPLPPLPSLDLIVMVGALARLIKMEDVNWVIKDSGDLISSRISGEALGSVVGLPTRRLPLLVYAPKAGSQVGEIPPVLCQLLTGQARCATLANLEAVSGFVEYAAMPSFGPGSIAVIWPQHSGENVVQVGGTSREETLSQLQRIVRQIIAGVCASVGPTRLPTQGTVREVGAHSDSEVEMLSNELQIAQEEIEELRSALSVADQKIAEKVAIIENREGLVDQLVQRNVELDIKLGQTPRGLTASSVKDAVQQAITRCDDLKFHPRLAESVDHFQHPDPSRILLDLLRLNQVAGEWERGAVSTAAFGIACSSYGLDYTPNISLTAKQRYADDYLFEWRGRNFYAGDHLSRGKKANLYRIHFFLDITSREVVVCYIGRHLRDKSSN